MKKTTLLKLLAAAAALTLFSNCSSEPQHGYGTHKAQGAHHGRGQHGGGHGGNYNNNYNSHRGPGTRNGSRPQFRNNSSHSSYQGAQHHRNGGSGYGQPQYQQNGYNNYNSRSRSAPTRQVQPAPASTMRRGPLGLPLPPLPKLPGLPGS